MTSDLITLNEAVRLLPKRHGDLLKPKTMARWVRRGCKGVFLKAVKVGGSWFTSEAWISEFTSKCSSPAKHVLTSGSATASQVIARGLLKRIYGFNENKQEGKESGLLDLHKRGQKSRAMCRLQHGGEQKDQGRNAERSRSDSARSAASS